MERAYGTKCISVYEHTRVVVVKLAGMHETVSTRDEFAAFCKARKLRWSPEESAWYFDTKPENGCYSEADRERVGALIRDARQAGFEVEEF